MYPMNEVRRPKVLQTIHSSRLGAELRSIKVKEQLLVIVLVTYEACREVEELLGLDNSISIPSHLLK